MRAGLSTALIAVAIVSCLGCHPGPVLGTGKEMKVGGTIAGRVSAADQTTAVVSRKVTVVNVATGARFEATTGVDGGYTIKVPTTGTYRIEVELRPGEAITKKPEDTHITNGDIDSGRDFVITIKTDR